MASVLVWAKGSALQLPKIHPVGPFTSESASRLRLGV